MLIRFFNNIESVFFSPQRFGNSPARATTVLISKIALGCLSLGAAIGFFSLVAVPVTRRIWRCIRRVDVRVHSQEFQNEFPRENIAWASDLGSQKPLKTSSFRTPQAKQVDPIESPRVARKRKHLDQTDIFNIDKQTLENLLITYQSDLGLIKLALNESYTLRAIHNLLVAKIMRKEKTDNILPELKNLKDLDCFKKWLEEQYDKGKENYKQILLNKHPHSLLECDEFVNEFNYLDECNCRTINSSIRTDLENLVIKEVEKKYDTEKFNNPKNSPFTIVSVGGGMAFQDLVYLGKLANMGYHHIKLVTIDNDNETEKALEDLKKFKEQYLPELNLEIEHHGDLSSLKGQKPQVILMVDIAGEANFLKESLEFFNIQGMCKDTILGYTNWTTKERGLQTAFCKTY